MKKNLLAFVCSSILALGLAGRALAADAGLPSLIVAPFSGDITHIAYWQPAMGEGLQEMLITELGKINKFQVLETTQLGALKDEIKMGEDGWVEQGEKVDKGGFAAADFMFTAKVTRFGNKETKVGLSGFVPRSLGSLGVKQTTADVRIDWRLVDAANRKIIKTGSSTAAQKGLGFNAAVNVTGHGGGIGFDNKEFMESALGKATVTALNQITEEVKPVTLPESGRVKIIDREGQPAGRRRRRRLPGASEHTRQSAGRGQQRRRHRVARQQPRPQDRRQVRSLRDRRDQRRQRRGGFHG